MTWCLGRSSAHVSVVELRVQSPGLRCEVEDVQAGVSRCAALLTSSAMAGGSYRSDGDPESPNEDRMARILSTGAVFAVEVVFEGVVGAAEQAQPLQPRAGRERAVLDIGGGSDGEVDVRAR